MYYEDQPINTVRKIEAAYCENRAEYVNIILAECRDFNVEAGS
jgi:hypothetical protein